MLTRGILLCHFVFFKTSPESKPKTVLAAETGRCTPVNPLSVKLLMCWPQLFFLWLSSSPQSVSLLCHSVCWRMDLAHFLSPICTVPTSSQQKQGRSWLAYTNIHTPSKVRSLHYPPPSVSTGISSNLDSLEACLIARGRLLYLLGLVLTLPPPPDMFSSVSHL